MANARDLYPVTASERDSLYRCKICGAIVRYEDRLKHSKFHETLDMNIAENRMRYSHRSEPPPF